jgi:FkbM family methyltransferase
MTTQGNFIFKLLSTISRQLNFLPRGKVGVLLNSLTWQKQSHPIVKFELNNGLKFISDLRSYTENYVPWTGEYEGISINSVLPLLEGNENILDIGANVGYWTVNLATKINDKNKVYAFEPILSNFNRLVEMTNLNKMQNKIQSFNLGLADKPGNVGFSIKPEDIKNHADTFNAKLDMNDGGDCEIVTFDSLVEQEKINNIGFIKIDIEGYEIKFLKGATKFFSQNRPVIYGEFTPEDILETGESPDFLFSFLKDYKFYQDLHNGTFKLINGTDYTRDILIVPSEKLPDLLRKGLLIVS